MFKEDRNSPHFHWKMLGDVREGRPNLGPTTDVEVYRLMQFTLRDILIQEFNPETTDRLFYRAGALAGKELCRAVLDRGKDFSSFITEVRDLLEEKKIGILRIEMADLEQMRFTLTVAEDIDCSGLPMSDETICTYDEGFISGIFTEYTGKQFKAKEVDCWCSGDRVCRFEVTLDN